MTEAHTDDFFPESISTAPIRSVLYSEVPRGAGTAYIESLGSYVARVAGNHGVPPDALLREIVIPRTMIAGSQQGSTFFSQHLRTLNGYGKYAREIARALSLLTGVQGIADLTLQPWGWLLDAKGTGVIAPHSRWCKTCLNDDRGHPGGAYMQLAWQLTPTTHCVQHWCALDDRCPHCQQRQRAVSRHNLVGRCSECAKWLGDGSVTPVSGLPVAAAHRARFYSLAVAEMIHAGQTPLGDKPLQDFRRGLQECINAFADGSVKTLEASTGMSNGQVRHWITSGLPGLGPLLDLSYSLSCTPVAILEGRIPDRTRARTRYRPWAHSPGHSTPLTDARDVSADLLARLVAAKSETPPPTLASVALRLDVSVGYLRYWHASDCHDITARRSVDLEQRRMQKATRIRAEAQRTVAELVNSPGAVNRRLIDRALNSKGLSLKHPEARAGMREALKTAAVTVAGEQPPGTLKSR